MIFEFNNYLIDSTNFRLAIDGKECEIEPLAFDLLVFLIVNKNRVVTRDEIFDSVWGDKQVLDSTLSNHIKILRAVLNDDGRTQSVIKTIRGRGYQFIASVKSDFQSSDKTIIKSKPVNASLSKKFIFAITFTLILFFLIDFLKPTQLVSEPNENRIIAVLPLMNAIPNDETDYFGFAITDQIIGRLIYLSNITVRASSSVKKYVTEQSDPIVIGKSLNADYVLTGNYLIANKRVRFNIELVDVTTGSLVWRENSFEVDYQDTFQLQDIVSQKVIDGLASNFNAVNIKELPKEKPTDTLAYEYYLRSIAQPFTTNGNKLAIELLKKSISIDDTFAPTYSQLGDRIRRYEQYGLLNSEELIKPIEYYKKALSLNKNLLSSLSNLAFYYCETNQLDYAVELANRMIEINPSSADAHFTLGYIYRYAGLIEESIKEMEFAVKIDPTNIRYRSLVASYSGVKSFDKIEKRLSHYSKNSFTQGWNALLNYRLGNIDEAKKFFHKIVKNDPHGLWGLVSTIHLSKINNEKEKGLIATHKLEQTSVTDSETVYYIAGYYAMFEDRGRTLNALKKSVDSGYFNFVFMQNSPYFDFLRKDQEFIAIVNDAKEKSYQFRSHQQSLGLL